MTKNLTKKISFTVSKIIRQKTTATSYRNDLFVGTLPGRFSGERLWAKIAGNSLSRSQTSGMFTDKAKIWSLF